MIARLSLLLALILVVGFAPAPFPRKERAVKLPLLQRMQGWWKIIDEVSSGQPGRNAQTSKLRLLVKNDTLTYYNAEVKADGWTITVNEGTFPPELDKMALGSPRGTAPSYHGRVTQVGDLLSISWINGSSPRPPDLTGKQGTAIRFRREQ